MDWIRVRRGVLQTLTAFEVAAGQKVLGPTLTAAVFDAGTDRSPAAGVEVDVPARIECGLGGHVDHACGSQPVLCRQCPIEQVQVAYKTGFEYRTQRRNPVRQLDAVDPILHVGVLIAHVKIRIADCRIVGNAGGLQQQFVDRGVLALRHGLDGLLANVVSGGAELGQQILVARQVQRLILLAKQ